jgi:hypothetical protein
MPNPNRVERAPNKEAWHTPFSPKERFRSSFLKDLEASPQADSASVALRVDATSEQAAVY